MKKSQIKRLIGWGLMLAVLVGMWGQLPTAHAAQTLPAAQWYAVTWVQDTDTLHWINANGEQASLPRPMLNGEISLAQTRMHIVPNGQMMVMIAPLNTGREAIAFYNFATGQFVQTHETQPNEVVLPLGQNPSTLTSGHFSAVLRDQVTGAWRIIIFELATGNAVAQITSSDPDLNPNIPLDPNWWPYVVQTHADIAINTISVNFQMVTHEYAPQYTFPSFTWFPSINPDGVKAINPAAYFYNRLTGYDLNALTGEVVWAWYDQDQFGAPPSPATGTTVSKQIPPGGALIPVLNDASSRPSRPRWLKGGDWIGYYKQDDVHAPHWVIMGANGENPLPLGPNISRLIGTPDGFLTVDTATWQMNHATSNAFEAFSATVGTPIFQTANQSFGVIYVTPVGSPFSLQTLAESGIGMGDVLAPDVVSCPGAPAPRLVVGQGGRVTFTNGLPSNVRNTPGGESVFQIAEGTQFTVLAGPECVSNYLWWQINFDNNVGWAAEGDAQEYYLEPYIGGPTGIAPVPTATPGVPFQPGNVAPVPTATSIAVQPGVIAAPATPTPLKLTVGTIVNCTQSPPTQLKVGIPAWVVNNGGTLAMRISLTDEFPQYQLPAGQQVNVIGGPQCREDIRMWQVNTTLNGQAINGWVAEGYGQSYYLSPTP